MSYTDHVPLPSPQDLNSGLHSPSARFMVGAVGNPRQSYSNACQPPTNEAFKAHLATVDVGPFEVEGHHLFLRAIRAAFDDVAASDPDLIPLIGTAGLLCCRWVRGHPGVLSNHSFGCAIDLKIGGVLVPMGADWCSKGLLVIYQAMHEQKIYWGGGYHSRPDSMHFEASHELVASWGNEV